MLATRCSCHGRTKEQQGARANQGRPFKIQMAPWQRPQCLFVFVAIVASTLVSVRVVGAFAPRALRSQAGIYRGGWPSPFKPEASAVDGRRDPPEA